MILVIDNETSFVKIDDDKTSPSPYHPDNRLVSVGLGYEGDNGLEVEYWFLGSNKRKNDDGARERIQALLDKATLVVGHNLKFDLAWLLECGFKYEGAIWDTMIAEYVLARGQKISFSLEECCIRHNNSLKKSDLIKEYIDNGVSFEDIDPVLVEEYGRGDVVSTYELFDTQRRIYMEEANRILIPIRDMSFDFCIALLGAERAGIHIDRNTLNSLRDTYVAERDNLYSSLCEQARSVLGDTPFNLNSPSDLSKLIYSREITDKSKWVETFGIGSVVRNGVRKKRKPKFYPQAAFVQHVRSLSTVFRRTDAVHCERCKGTGKYTRTKVDGSPFKRSTVCPDCSGRGFLLVPNGRVAGFRQVPLDSFFVTADGFATSKGVLEILARSAKEEDAKKFLTNMVRYNAVDSYINSFISGIERGTQGDNLLHPQFMQCVTATGRLSSKEPNFQNQPRGSTFPIRRAVTSRWLGGSILEGDYRQLEFRIAVELAQDAQGLKDIVDGIDVHIFTRDTITAAGQSIDRQAAKPHTFKPLYGGETGTDAEQAYYRAFAAKYSGIAKWWDSLQDEAIRHKMLTLPSGRQYVFMGAKRLPSGRSTYRTQILNYPVQGAATADLQPVAFILIHQKIKEYNLKSRLILTVHDSNIMDVYPGEEEIAKKVLSESMLGAVAECERRFGWVIKTPIDIEMKMGKNWLDMKEVHYG